MKKDSLGNRMKKNYEDRTRYKLIRRMPVIIRLDGKAFHTLTRNCTKPFDILFADAMKYTAYYLVSEIQGAKCAYVQSDEISILLTDFDTLQTGAWFDNNVQKMTSISAGMASAYFSDFYLIEGRIAVFDSRVFNIPREEVCNYFIWRQNDWIRNSVQMLASAYYSHKELHKKKQKDMHEMLYQKEINWADLEGRWKNGVFLYKTPDFGWRENNTIFSKNRDSIERYLNVD